LSFPSRLVGTFAGVNLSPRKRGAGIQALKNSVNPCLKTKTVSLSKYLKSKWEDMFGIEFDVLLYDLTSTYFEGLCEQNPKARFGYSRDKRPDCRQANQLNVLT